MSQDQEKPRIQFFQDWYNQGSENRDAEILQERWGNIDCTRPIYDFFNWLYKDKDKWNTFVEALPNQEIILNDMTLTPENNNLFNDYIIPSNLNLKEIKLKQQAHLEHNDEVNFNVESAQKLILDNVNVDVYLYLIIGSNTHTLIENNCIFSKDVCLTSEHRQTDRIIIKNSEFKGQLNIKKILGPERDQYQSGLYFYSCHLEFIILDYINFYCLEFRDCRINNFDMVYSSENILFYKCLISNKFEIRGPVSECTFVFRNVDMKSIDLKLSDLKHFEISESKIDSCNILVESAIIDVFKVDVNNSYINLKFSLNFRYTNFDICNQRIDFKLHHFISYDEKKPQSALSLDNLRLEKSSIKILKDSITEKPEQQGILTTRLHSIVGNEGSVKFEGICFDKPVDFKHIFLYDMIFNDCDFNLLPLKMNYSSIERNFSLDGTNQNVKSLDLRYCNFNGILAIDSSIQSKLHNIIDLRDTKIANVPSLDQLDPNKNKPTSYDLTRFFKKKTYTKIFSKVRPRASIKERVLDFFDFVALSVLLCFCCSFLLDYATSSTFAVPNSTHVLAYTCKVITLLIFTLICGFVLKNSFRFYFNYASDSELESNASKYCRLKSLAHQNQSHDLALRFTAAEHKAKRYGEFGCMATLLDYMMEITSNYGMSIARPFLCLIFFNIIAFDYHDQVFATHKELEQYEAPLVIRNVVATIAGGRNTIRQDMQSAIKNINDKHVSDHEKYMSDNDMLSLDIASGLQALISFFFIFLIGLGLRNRYKI